MYETIHELQEAGSVTAGISLRIGGVSEGVYASLNVGAHVGDDAEAVATNRQLLFQQLGLERLHVCRQVHGNRVVTVDAGTEGSGEDAPEADALISATPNTTLGIFTADCVPIFILDSVTPAIGIAHAGWRGTFATVGTHTLSQMTARFGTRPADCRIHLGPAILHCCYTVSRALLTQFEERFGSTVHNGKTLNLHAANVIQLIEAGVPRDAISTAPFCTACRTDLFYSHRYENGRTGRMLSFIRLNAENGTEDNSGDASP